MKKTLSRLLVIIYLLILTNPIWHISAEVSIAPVEIDYQLPGQDWSFINISSLEVNKTADYEWRTNITVRGLEVTLTQYQNLFGMTNFERASYFETLGYIESQFDRIELFNGIEKATDLIIQTTW